MGGHVTVELGALCFEMESLMVTMVRTRGNFFNDNNTACSELECKLIAVMREIRLLWMETPLLAVALVTPSQRARTARLMSRCFGHTSCRLRLAGTVRHLVEQTPTWIDLYALLRIFVTTRAITQTTRRSVGRRSNDIRQLLIDTLCRVGVSATAAEDCQGVAALLNIPFEYQHED